MTTLLRPEPPRDGWGRYLFDRKPHTRVSTVAKTLEDPFTLIAWKQRQTALGVASRPDLVAGVLAARGDKRALNELVDTAMIVSGSNAGAITGTAIHTFCEWVERGQDISTVPVAQQPDVTAYLAELERIGAVSLPEWIERMVVIDGLDDANGVRGTGGTVDRMVRIGDQLMIADIKSGQSLDFAWGAIAIQLACYAHASAAIVDPVSGSREPMPAGLSLTSALVFHVPAGQGVCTTYVVDIEAGWEAAQLAIQARTWRRRKHLARVWKADEKPVTVERVIETFGPDTVVQTNNEAAQEWIRKRVRDLDAAASGLPLQLLKTMWPAHVPKGPAAVWNDTEIDELDAVLAKVEGHFQRPFADPDPRRGWTTDSTLRSDLATASAPRLEVEALPTPAPPATPEPSPDYVVADSVVGQLATALGQLSPDHLRVISMLQSQASTPWSFKATRTIRPFLLTMGVARIVGRAHAGDMTELVRVLQAIAPRYGREVPTADMVAGLDMFEAEAFAKAAELVAGLPADSAIPPDLCSAIGWTPTKQTNQEQTAA